MSLQSLVLDQSVLHNHHPLVHASPEWRCATRFESTARSSCWCGLQDAFSQLPTRRVPTPRRVPRQRRWWVPTRLRHNRHSILQQLRSVPPHIFASPHTWHRDINLVMLNQGIGSSFCAQAVECSIMQPLTHQVRAMDEALKSMFNLQGASGPCMVPKSGLH